MGLNFLGVGFSFGAKDYGLAKATKQAASGFANIKEAYRGIESGSVDAMDATASAIRGMRDNIEDASGEIKSSASDIVDAFANRVLPTLKDTAFFFGRRAEEIKKKGTDVISEGFGTITDKLTQLNQTLRVNRLANFITEVGVDKLKGIADGIADIGTSGINLTNGLEATQRALSKSARSAAVNLGLTGAELESVKSQAASMAYNLNIGADASTAALVGMKTAGEELGAVGISSAADLAKLADVTGINSQQFAMMLKHMTSLKLGEKEISGIVGSFTAMGRETQDVAGGLGAITEVMDLVSSKAALMGQTLEPDRLAAFAQQTAGLAAGLGKFGIEASKARSISQSLAGSQVDAQKAFAGLFAGTSSDLPEMLKELAITGMDVQDAFDMMDKGPEGMIEGLQAMVDNAKSSGADMDQFVTFMAQRLGKAGIDNADTLINFLAQGDEATKDIMKSTAGATANLGKLAKEGFDAGFTLQDQFDRAKDSMVTSFRAIGGARQAFVRDSAKEFGKFATTLNALADKGGPMGKLVETMSDMHSLGALGLIPETLRPMVALFGTAMGELKPFIAGLAGITALFGPVAGAAALLTGGLVLLGAQFVALRMESDSWGEAWDKFTAKLKGSWQKFQQWFVKAGPKAFDALRDGLKSLKRGAGKAFDRVVDSAKSFTDRLNAAVQDVDWKDVFTKLFTRAVEGVKAAASKAQEVGRAIVSAFFGGATEAGGETSKLASTFSNIGDILTTVFKGLAAAAADVNWSEVFGTLMNAFASFLEKGNELLQKIDFGKLAGVILDLVGSALDALGSKEVGNFMSKIVGFLIDRVEILAHGLLDVFDAALDWLGKQDLAATLGPIVNNIVKIAGTIIEKMLPVLAGIVERLPGLIKKAFPIIINALKGLPSMLAGSLKGMGKKIGPAVREIVPVLVDAAWKSFKFMFTELPQMILGALPDIISGLWDLYWEISDFIGEIWMGIGEGLLDTLEDYFPESVKAVKGFLSSVPGYAEDAWDALGDGYNAAVDWLDALPAKASKAWDTIQAGAEKAADWISEVFGEAWSNMTEGLYVLFVWPWEQVWAGVKAAWDWLFGADGALAKPFGELWDWITGIWKDFMRMAINNLRKLKGKWNRFFAAVKRGWDAMIAVVTEVWTAIKTAITNVIDAVTLAVEAFRTALVDVFQGLWDDTIRIWDGIGDSITGVWKRVKGVWDKAIGFFENLFEGIYEDHIKQHFDAITNGIAGAWDEVAAKWNQAAKFFDDLFGNIGKVIEDSFNWIKEKMADYIAPLILLFDGIQAIVDSLWTNSMHHEAEDSAKMTLEAHEEFIPPIVSELETIGVAIDSSFNQAYEKARKDTLRFKKSVVPDIREVADDIGTAFYDGLLPVAEMVDIIAEGIAGIVTKLETEVAIAMTALRSLEVQQKRVADAARAAAEEREEMASSEDSMPSQLGGLRETIDRPDWYYSSTDGLAMKMDQQTARFEASLAAMAITMGKVVAAAERGGGGGVAAALRSKGVAAGFKGAGAARGRVGGVAR